MKVLFPIFILFFNLLTGIEVKEGMVPCEEGQIYYRAVGKGNPIVIVHGGPGLDHTYLLPAMDMLAANHQVIYYDQRGTGKSVAEVNCETINMDCFVRDLEALRKELQLEKITLVGHSWGTLLATEYALKFPERVNSLILMSASPATHKGLERFYEKLEERLKPVSDQLVQIELSENFKNCTPDAIAKYLQTIFPKYFYDENKMLLLDTKVCSATAANFLRVGELLDNDYLGEYDLLDKLKTLTTPTLILHGDHDPVPKKYAEQLHDHIKNSKYLVIQGSGHFLFIEQPRILFKAIKEFLTHVTQIGKEG